MEHRFWAVTRNILNGRADFNDASLLFDLKKETVSCPAGRYQMISKHKDKKNIEGYFLYRMSHPLGEHVLDAAQKQDTPIAELTFDVSGHPVRISAVEQFKGKSGWLILSKLTIKSFEKDEYLL